MTSIEVKELLKRGNTLTDQLSVLNEHRRTVYRMSLNIGYDCSDDGIGNDPCMSGVTIYMDRNGWHKVLLKDEFIPTKKDIVAAYLLNVDNRIKAIEKQLEALVPPAPAPEPEKGKPGRKKRK